MTKRVFADPAAAWRRIATAGGTAVLVLAGGCGEDVTIDSSNRGAGSHTQETTVDNAFIVPDFVPGSCEIQIGGDAHLRFTATNNRSTDSESLSGITTEAAQTVRILAGAPVVIPPRSSVAAGQPIEHPGEQTGPDEPFTVAVQGLTESVRPGMSVDVSFRFAKYGDLTLRVPIEACPTQNG